MCSHAGILHRCWGFELRSPYFYSKCCYPLSHILSISVSQAFSFSCYHGIGIWAYKCKKCVVDNAPYNHQ